MLREWWSKLRAVVTRDRLDDDLRAEMDAHLQMEVEARVERGMIASAAQQSAAREFGNRTRIEESSRETWMFLWLETLVQDIRYGVRVLRRSPGFALTGLPVIALGPRADRDAGHRARRRRQHRGVHAARSRPAQAASLRPARSPRHPVRVAARQWYSADVDFPAQLRRLARHELQLRVDGRLLRHPLCRESLRPGRADAARLRHRQLGRLQDAGCAAGSRPRVHRRR